MPAPPPAPAPAPLARFLAAGLLGRLSYGTGALAQLLLVRQATGSYAAAGLALLAAGGTTAALAGARARLVVRHGARPALTGLVLVHAAVLALLASAPALSVPAAGLCALCALAGAAAPPLGPTTRAVLGRLLPDGERLRRAYARDAVADEVLFTAGPLLAAGLAATCGPAVAVLAGAGLVLAGTLGAACSPLAPAAAGRAPAGPALRPLRDAAARRLVRGTFGMGLGLGALELAAVGLGERWAPGAGGLLVATVALGSAGGGLLYGRRGSRRPPAALLRCAGVAMATALLLAAAASQAVGPFAAVALLGGATVAPALVAAYAVADELGGPGRQEAGTLVQTANNLGTAVGTALGGVVLEAAGLRAALAAAALVTAASTLRRRRQSRPSASRSALRPVTPSLA